MIAVKKERRYRNESPLIPVKEETWSPSGENAYYTQAQEPTEEGEASDVTTSEEDHEDDADKRRRRKK